MKKAILMLSLMTIWASGTMAQQPISDPFAEMFKLAVKADRRELSSDGTVLGFRDYQLFPSYKLEIYVLMPTLHLESLGTISICAYTEDKASSRFPLIIAKGTGTGKTWMERNWEYKIGSLLVPLGPGITNEPPTMETVSKEVAKDAAKKFLDLWHRGSSIAPKKLHPFIEGLRQGLDCVGLEQQGYDCKCVEAVREMVKSGEISKARGDFMIGRECKKLPPTPKADSGQDIMTFECMNRHIWQSRWLGNCPFCGGIGFPK